MIARINRFTERNRGAVLSKAWEATLVRLWLRLRLREALRPMIRPRQPQGWIFMGGCYNSGTTILREILGAHPDIGTLPREGLDLTDAFPDLEQGGWPRMGFRNAQMIDQVNADPTAAADRAQRDWSLWWDRGAKVFLEKSILHGAWMPALEQGFQGARFIGVVRNGYCACEGIRRRSRPAGVAAQLLGQATYPIDEVGRQWVFSNQALRRDGPKLGQYREIRYEDFTANPAGTARDLFRFVGLDDRLVQDQGGGKIRVGTREFTISNQNADSIARLTSSDLAAINPVISPMMRDLGYDVIEENPV